MKHLLNLTPDEVDGWEPPFPDRSLGEPVATKEWPLANMPGWKGLYTTDETIMGWEEARAKGKANYAAGVKEWLTVPMEMGDQCLNVLPPALHRGGAFAMGEPYTHDGGGRAVYLCFRGFSWSNSTCQLQYLTLQDFVALLTAR